MRTTLRDPMEASRNGQEVEHEYRYQRSRFANSRLDMNLQTTNLGGLSCVTIDDLPSPCNADLVVILCHGFGAPGNDLVPIGEEVFQQWPHLAKRVRFIFPAAPLTLDAVGMFGVRAWWHLDVMGLSAAMESRKFPNETSELLQGMAEARALMAALVEQVKSQMGVPMSHVVLGGFSQGAVITTDLIMRSAEPPAALCIFSGTLVCEETWKQAAPKHRGLRVLQSHGRQDPLLPFQAAVRLKDLLQNAGWTVDFLPFNGEHTIPYEVLIRFGVLLGNLLDPPGQRPA